MKTINLVKGLALGMALTTLPLFAQSSPVTALSTNNVVAPVVESTTPEVIGKLPSFFTSSKETETKTEAVVVETEKKEGAKAGTEAEALQTTGTTAATAAAASTAAATTSIPTSTQVLGNSTLDKLKANKVALRLETESFTERNPEAKGDKPVSSVWSNLYPMVSWEAFENTSFFVYPMIILDRDYITENAKNDSKMRYHARDGYLALRFDQKILEEEKNGLNFTASTRYYARLTEDSKYEWKQNGELNIRLMTSKKFNDKFSITSDARFYFVNTSEKYRNSNPNLNVGALYPYATYRHDIYLIPSMNITDKLSTYVEFLQRTNTSPDVIYPSPREETFSTNDRLRLAPGLSYKYSDKFSTGFQLSSYILNSHNNEGRLNEYFDDLTATAFGTYAFTKDISAYLEIGVPLVEQDAGSRGSKFFTDKSKQEYSIELDLSIGLF